MKRWILLMTTAAALSAAQAQHVCTDADGKRSYQDRPCEALPTKTQNAPLAAGRLDAKTALAAIQRYQAAMSDRDTTAAVRFLARGFSSRAESPKGTEAYDRRGFVQLLTRVLNAASQFRSQANCAAPVADGAKFRVTCAVTESLEILGRKQGANSTEVYTVLLEDGEVRFSEIVSTVK
jgi:hypothetical protein